MRVFFALDPEDFTRRAIDDWRAGEALVGRPVPAANFHLTLAFIGDLANAELERLCQRVDRLCEEADFAAVDTVLDTTGYWARPGIWWLGPSDTPNTVTALAERLRGIGSRYGGRADRKPFQAHLTLSRHCELPPPAPLVAPNFTLQCLDFSLFESRQGRGGVSYHPLATWSLGVGGL